MFTWEKTKLDKLGTLRTGSLRNRFASDSAGKKVNYVTQSILNGELYVKKLMEYFPEEELRNNLFPAGTICINVDKSVASILKESSYLHENVIGFKPFKNLCDSGFIKYYLEFSEVKLNFRDPNSTKTNTVTIQKLLDIVFLKPPLKLQEKIGEVIKNYDLLLINYEDQIKILEEIRGMLFQKYFENYRPLRKQKLKNLVYSSKGRSEAKDSVNEGAYVLFTYSLLNKKTNDCHFDKEALILCTHSENRYIKYFFGKFSAFSGIFVLTVKNPKLTYWLLEAIKFYLASKNKNVWLYEFDVPEDSLLDSFNQYAGPIQKKINSLSRQIELLKNSKKELIEEIYSQRIDFKTNFL